MASVPFHWSFQDSLHPSTRDLFEPRNLISCREIQGPVEVGFRVAGITFKDRLFGHGVPVSGRKSIKPREDYPAQRSPARHSRLVANLHPFEFGKERDRVKSRSITSPCEVVPELLKLGFPNKMVLSPLSEPPIGRSTQLKEDGLGSAEVKTGKETERA